MKKTVALLFCFVLLLPGLCSCSGEEESDVRYDYDLSRYIEVGDIQGLEVAFEDPSLCTEEEIDRAQFQVQLSYATFEKKEGSVELYNKVEILYRMYRNGVEMEDYTEEAYQIVVGSEGFGDMDYAMGQALIGASVGDCRETEYTFPEDDVSIGGWAGITVTLQGTVKAVYQHHLPECNEEFVSTLEGEGGSFGTVEEFRLALADSLRTQKEAARDHAVFTAYMNSVKVKKYPQKELQEYMERERSQANTMAESLSLSLGEYLKLYLATDEKSYEKTLEESAREQVKNDMACIQLSRLLGTEISQEEYDNGLERLFEEEGGAGSSGFDSSAEFEAAYTPHEIRESLLWEKSFRALVANVTRLDP